MSTEAVAIAEPIEMTVTLRNNLVKSRRLQRGWTQKQLAQAANVSAITVSHIECFCDDPLPETVEKLARALNCDADELYEPWMQEIRQSRSVKMLRKEDVPMLSFSEVKTLPAPDCPELACSVEEMKRQIEKAMHALKQREQRALRLCFGLDDGREYTYAEIGAELGVTASRVGQMINHALRKIHQGKHLQDFQ